MEKQAVISVRVSDERQAADDKVSIEQQLTDCRALAEAQGFTIVAEFVDKERYVKTKPPYKGRKVQPSGKYDDRPGFVAMLERIEQDDIDAIIAWDSYRIGRHLRVLGALANSLDIAAQKRRNQIEIWEASKRSVITRVVLGIMISIAQEENETRQRRVKMGKIGTLQQGRWPGNYKRYGYDTIEEDGKRGVAIKENHDEAEAVKLMFDLADKGQTLSQIRDELIARSIPQKGGIKQKRKRAWTSALVGKILRSPDYTGKATYKFSDGEKYEIEIPQIIDPEQWARVQQKLTQRIKLSTRNTKTTWAAVQHIAFCGECGGKLTMRTTRFVYKTNSKGERVRYDFDVPKHTYTCCLAHKFKGEIPHQKINHYGPNLDYAVWRKLVDEAITHPELIREQVMNRRKELQAQGDGYDSEISRAKRELSDVEAGRDRLMNQLTKGIITEKDFERIMIERNREKTFWQEEYSRLVSLRNDAQKLESDLEHAYRILASYGEKLEWLDIPQDELKKRSSEEQIEILTERKRIIQSLCERITVFGEGRVEIDGLIDTGRNCEANCLIRESRL